MMTKILCRNGFKKDLPARPPNEFFSRLHRVCVAMSAFVIYQIIKDRNRDYFFTNPHRTKQEADTMHFTFIKESTCREHGKF